MVVVVVGALTMVVVVVGGRKGFPQEVLGSHVTASDLERLMSESYTCSFGFVSFWLHLHKKSLQEDGAPTEPHPPPLRHHLAGWPVECARVECGHTRWVSQGWHTEWYGCRVGSGVMETFFV